MKLNYPYLRTYTHFPLKETSIELFSLLDLNFGIENKITFFFSVAASFPWLTPDHLTWVFGICCLGI